MREAGQQVDNERVESILAQLEEEIGRHRMALGQMGALDPPDVLAQARQHKWVNSHLPIGWPTMPTGIMAKAVAVAQKVVRRLLRWYINPIIDQQNRYNEAVFERLVADQTNTAQVAGQVHTLQDQVTRLAATNQSQQAVAADIRALATQVESLQQAVEAQQAIIHDERTRHIHDQEVVRFRLQRLENLMRPGTPNHAARMSVSEHDAKLPPIDYYLLGLLHRSEDQLQARLSDYDDLFQASLPGPVLDLGCGRGDLVERIASLDLDAHGIDLDDEAVRIGQALGRSIETGDMFDYLSTVPDQSLGAVVMIQVAEHLTFDALRSLLADTLRALAPGGLIIIETINPTCITALTNAYLLDPSHVAPLHPLMTQFLLQEAGFAEVALRYLHEVAPPQQLQPTSDDPLDLGGNVGKLNRILYGPQDYAAIAVKREAS